MIWTLGTLNIKMIAKKTQQCHKTKDKIQNCTICKKIAKNFCDKKKKNKTTKNVIVIPYFIKLFIISRIHNIIQ